MNCPRCTAAMDAHTFVDALGRELSIDLCKPCQSFWFDGHESLQLSPGATLSLFRLIGEHVARPEMREGDVAKCPRCASALRRTHDMQRSTRFEYVKCPHEHGRLISFFDFLKAKDFIKPLTTSELAELRQHIQMVNCSNCGGPIDLARQSSCPHCSAPLSMLDMKQAEKLVEQLRNARPGDKRRKGPPYRRRDRCQRRAPAQGRRLVCRRVHQRTGRGGTAPCRPLAEQGVGSLQASS